VAQFFALQLLLHRAHPLVTARRAHFRRDVLRHVRTQSGLRVARPRYFAKRESCAPGVPFEKKKKKNKKIPNVGRRGRGRVGRDVEDVAAARRLRVTGPPIRNGSFTWKTEPRRRRAWDLEGPSSRSAQSKPARETAYMLGQWLCPATRNTCSTFSSAATTLLARWSGTRVPCSHPCGCAARDGASCGGGGSASSGGGARWWRWWRAA